MFETHMSVRNFYRYFFFRVYIWQLERFGEIHNPKFLALAALTLCFFAHFLTLNAIYRIATGGGLVASSGYAFGIFLLLFGLNYLVFVHGDQFDEIERRFSNETQQERRGRTTLCVLYSVITAVSFFFAATIAYR